MAATFAFTIDSEGLFPNRKVDITRFSQEIRGSGAISVALSDVTVAGGNCVVVFADNLSNDEVLALEALVFAHTGAPPAIDITGFTTTSNSYVAVPGLTVIPPAGSYRVRFTGSGYPQANNKQQSMAIFSDGALVTGSVRSIKSGGGQTAGMTAGFSCEAVVTVTGSQAVTAQLKSDASGNQTAEILNSTLTVGV